MLTKNHYRHITKACNAQEDCKEDLFNFIRENSVEVDYDENFWLILTDEERKLFDKCNQVGTPLSKWGVLMNYGIKSGATDAYGVLHRIRVILFARLGPPRFACAEIARE